MKRTALLGLLLILCMQTFTVSAQNKATCDSTSAKQVNISRPANIECIVPPTGFDTLTGLNGYYHRLIGASIILNVVEGKTMKDAEAAFNDEHIRNIKSTLISKSRMKLDDGNEMLVIHLTYEFGGETWGRYQCFTGDDKSTLWILISYPYKYNEDVEGVLLKSLRTAKFDQR